MSLNRYIDLLITSADFHNTITINMSFKSKVIFKKNLFYPLSSCKYNLEPLGGNHSLCYSSGFNMLKKLLLNKNNCHVAKIKK